MIKQSELSNQLRIYVITDQHMYWKKNPIDLMWQSINGGATCIQLRHKGELSRHVIEFGRCIKKLCDLKGVLFIVNDHITLFELVNADGFHVGKNDLNIVEARLRIGHRKILGRTLGKDDTLDFPTALVDYLGVGPIYETSSKRDAGSPCGVAFPDYARAQFKKPIVAIGGITEKNIHEISPHTDGVAFISSVARSSDPLLTIQNMRLKFYEAQKVIN